MLMSFVYLHTRGLTDNRLVLIDAILFCSFSENPKFGGKAIFVTLSYH